MHLLEDDQVSTPADLRIYLISPRSEVSEADPAPQLGAVARAIWAVIGRDGRRAMPAHSVDEAAVIGLLRENLEKLARYRNTLALKNANPSHLLKGKVDFTLKRQKANGSWEAIVGGAEDGPVVFEVDDRIAFEIVNRHNAPIYVSVLDFGLTGGISLLYPPNRPSEKFEPGGLSIKIGERAENKIELWIPDTFPYEQGIETFKLFATTREADFSWMQQGTVRSIDRDGGRGLDSLFQQLFDLVYSGLGTRDARPARVPPTEAWTTVERTFILRRKTP